MEQTPNMFVLNTLPGVQRDGTVLDAKSYIDSQWVRFQRGRPRKIGGYRTAIENATGRISAIAVFAQGLLGTRAFMFGDYGIEGLILGADTSDSGTLISTSHTGPVAPGLFNSCWQIAFANITGQRSILACDTPDAADISLETNGRVWSMDLFGSYTVFPLGDVGGALRVSGGCCILGPFAFIYGNQGLIRNSAANSTIDWVGVGANSANPVGDKVVKGLPLRGGGQTPAGLFWSLSSLLRVTFVGGTSIWKYDILSSSISVLAKNGIIEMDGVYYWVGVDRFYVYTGVVQELPSESISNYFFENLTAGLGNKCFATRVTRFGEIWWYFPAFGQTECSHAVIYNVREKVWYTAQIARRAAASAQEFKFPLAASCVERGVARLDLSARTGTFVKDQAITSSLGGVGVVSKWLTSPSTILFVTITSGSFAPTAVLTTATGTGTVGFIENQSLTDIWVHEVGTDSVSRASTTPIPAHFETDRFNFMTGGPSGEALGGNNLQTRIVRVEPDFIMPPGTSMTLTVKGTSYANSPVVTSAPFTFTNTTEFIDLREQRRECSLRFESNQLGGDFQMGSVVLTVEPGDVRG